MFFNFYFYQLPCTILCSEDPQTTISLEGEQSDCEGLPCQHRRCKIHSTWWVTTVDTKASLISKQVTGWGFSSSSSLIFWVKSSNFRILCVYFWKGNLWYLFVILICCCDWEENENVWKVFGNLTESQSTVGGGERYGKTKKKGKTLFWKPRKKSILIVWLVEN